MPISQKITSEINKLDIDVRIKDLMKGLLQLEENGVRRWNVEYETKIKKYISEREEDEN